MGRLSLTRDTAGGWVLWWGVDLYSPHVRHSVGHKWRVLARFGRRKRRG